MLAQSQLHTTHSTEVYSGYQGDPEKLARGVPGDAAVDKEEAIASIIVGGHGHALKHFDIRKDEVVTQRPFQGEDLHFAFV